MKNLYYTPPTDKSFNEMKKACIKIWKTYDDTYKYATGKIDRIKDIENIKDNFMYMYSMFDGLNKTKVNRELSTDAQVELLERLSF